MGSPNLVIVDCDKQEPLVPVVTFVLGLSHDGIVSSCLSFLTLCYQDCLNKIRKPNIIAPYFLLQCQYFLDDVIATYLNVDRLSFPAQTAAIETAHNILQHISSENATFILDRMNKTFGETICIPYWNTLNAPSYKDCLSAYSNGQLSSLQLKKTVDFAITIITLTVLYGCADDYYDRIAEMTNALTKKYSTPPQLQAGTAFPFDNIGLSLWPLEFSFMEKPDEPSNNDSEHLALLQAFRSINPDVKVQVCAAPSLLWARDIIAWVNDDQDIFIDSVSNDSESSFGCGLLCEGGNIIAGKAIDPFLLVSQGAFADVLSELAFIYEMDMRNIKTYVLPPGFLWSRDPVTKKEILLDSAHIDTVINFIPAQSTTDGKPKVIVDPYYYKQVLTNENFTRFLQQQSISAEDIIVVDDNERYLNLPNFSIVPDKNGVRKFIFNKETGLTLPRLKIRPGLIVQPEIEIVNMASAFGTIRCATNLLPRSYVKNAGTPLFLVSDSMPKQIKTAIVNAITNDKPMVGILSQLFVSAVVVQYGPKAIHWEYDYFSSTGYVYLHRAVSDSPEPCCAFVKSTIAIMAKTVGRNLGIDVAI